LDYKYIWMVIVLNNKAIVYKSIVDESIIKEFEEWRGDTLYEHSSNSNCIDGFISAACVLCPDIIDVDGYIFLLDFINRVGNQDDDPIEKVGMWKNNLRMINAKLSNGLTAGTSAAFLISRTLKKYLTHMPTTKKSSINSAIFLYTTGQDDLKSFFLIET